MLRAQAGRLIADGERVAGLPAFREALTKPTSQAAVAGAASVLQTARRGSSQVHDIALVDLNGVVIASSGLPDPRVPRPDRGAQLETVSDPVIGPLTASGDTVVYAVTAPVASLAGERLGYVVVTRRLIGGSETAALMSGLVGRGARVLIGNADGSLFTDLTKPVKTFASPRPGTTLTYSDSTGTRMLGASVSVLETPWMVVVETPRAGALEAATKFTLDSASVGVVFILVGALLSWLLIRRTMRPLGEVTDAAREITAGNLSRRAAVEGHSEIAVLGDAFNQMVERVSTTTQDLAARATQLEASNKELNESEAKYRSLFEHLPDGILVHRDYRILFANPAALRLLGVASEKEMNERTLLDYITPADRDVVLRRIEQVVTGSVAVPTVELRMQRADRRVTTVEATSMPLRINGGPAVQTVLHDVSERRQLEEQFRQSQKMDAVGRLAGGVAHDFNNLLTVIQANAEFAMSPTETDEERRRDIEEIRKTADHAARLTRQLLTFSRKQTVTPTHLDLNEAISGMLGMIHRLIGDNIEVVTLAGDRLASIWADPGQIQQVMLNLAVNARDAMPDGGVLRFETANITVGEGYVGAASGAIPPGEYVMLAVQDTGIGMTEEIRQRVFEPFFTTKQPGQGTGLGLSTVYGIVKQAGGHIWVYSEPGMGTAFKVFFPPHREDGRQAVVSRNSGAYSVSGQGHLLVVEDDASVRTAVVRALRGAGYLVTEAKNAEEALVVLDGTESIDMMITDMVMPGMQGIALLAEARSRRPRLPAIVLSGYSGQPSNEMWRVPDHAVFVEKPVSPTELIRRVGQMLASRI
jgi:two-component system cell cycle sensor histidine kinase/response regulator CckA